jgi:hypothetical protein
MFFDPGQKRGTKIEIDLRVVVDDIHNPSIRIEDTRGGVGGIAFCSDSFIPIMVGIGGILELHRLKPGVLPRGLVKMPMDTNISVCHGSSE